MRELIRGRSARSLGFQLLIKSPLIPLKWVLPNSTEGVNTSSGYGNPRTQTVPPNPSKNYAAQLAAFNGVITRESVAAALDQAKIDRIPNRPNGRHVASDLIAYFYSSADGEDFLYGVEIKRDDCRGLANSTQRPKRIYAEWRSTSPTSASSARESPPPCSPRS